MQKKIDAMITRLTQKATKIAVDEAKMSQAQYNQIKESIGGIWTELNGAQDPDMVPPAEQMAKELEELAGMVHRMDKGMQVRDQAIIAALDRHTDAFLKLQAAVIVHQRSKP